MDKVSVSEADVVLIGAGIMSATLGVLLKELQPDLKIQIFEKLDFVGGESSDAWNNAGTGHSAFCELNYTPLLKNGSVDISKALKISESFEMSLQFWSYLIRKGVLRNPETFLRSVPHVSFVWGQENVDYLRKRYEALRDSPLFEGMEFSEQHDVIKEWIPLVMEGRDSSESVAATRVLNGTDVNFGALTRQLFKYLESLDGVKLHLNHKVRKLSQDKNSVWRLSVKNLNNKEKRKIHSKFVFIGAGGGSLPLLLKTGISEGKNFGGFPVSGQWLRCTNPEVIKKHHAKVYGKAEVGSPPMSVPHLDTRVINGKQELLFGPYAGFTTRFLKQGSYWDLPLSIKPGNLYPMLSAGIKNIPLTKYLINQVLQSEEDRFAALKKYFPNAKKDDWKLEVAGKRVQVIKKDPKKGGVLEFGTEVVCGAKGTVAALLGASPGASTAVTIMLKLIKQCFKDKVAQSTWSAKLNEMIPYYGCSVSENPEFCKKIQDKTHLFLKIKSAPPKSKSAPEEIFV